jgi:hypothetical protein
MIGHPLRVRELLDEVSRGEVLLPEIQRAYVWKRPQVAKLIDSLYREYPAGQILLWDTINLPITKNLEGAEKTLLPTIGRPKIILDGQQRITSLHLALGNVREPIDVYFNLETEQFQLFQRRLKSDPRWISVRATVNGERHDLDILRDVEEAGGPGREDPATRRYLDRLQRLRAIGDYKFPIEIFRSDDYEEVTELFVRINASGTRLRAAELVLAQLALRLPGAIVSDFEQAMDEYDRLWYELDTRFLVRTLIAIGTGQSRFKHLTEFWGQPSEKLHRLWSRVKKSIDTAVNFVRLNARFEASDWLPSLMPLLPLVAYFDRYSAIAPRVERDLLRWFYAASLFGRYSSSAETALDEDLKAIASTNPVEGLMKNVAPLGRTLEVGSDEFDDAGWRNPLFAISYAAVRKNGAKDWFSGVTLATDVAGADHEVQVHHIFPKAYLKEHGVKRNDRDEIANLAFLAAKPNRKISARPPHVYLEEIASEHPERLESQFVPMDRELWRIENFQRFLEARRKLLADAVNDLLRDPC